MAAIGPACFQIRQAIRELGLSEAKQLHGIRDAASLVEGRSDQIAHLLALLARSRVLELDVVTKQFGPVLPSDFLKKLKQDLTELENATSPGKYVDDKARYLGGHPGHDEIADGALTIEHDHIRFVSTDSSVIMAIPISGVDYVLFETQRLCMEQAEMEEGVLVDEFSTLLRPTTVVVVKDPEDVYPEGFKVRFGFRNDYYARLFAKKCSDRLGVPPF